MGRWGHRLFEGDDDCDTAAEVAAAIREKSNDNSITVDYFNIHDMLRDMIVRPPSSDAQQCLLNSLNSGLCDELFDQFRSTPDPFGGQYRIIVLGAMMMQVGANISKENMECLRTVCSNTPSSPGRVLFEMGGFRDPGKAQFTAALQRYCNGVPRDFMEPSCFRCGKMNCDLSGKSLKKCGKCKSAWYCDTSCQKDGWKTHKALCFKDGVRPAGPGGYSIMNV